MRDNKEIPEQEEFYDTDRLELGIFKYLGQAAVLNGDAGSAYENSLLDEFMNQKPISRDLN